MPRPAEQVLEVVRARTGIDFPESRRAQAERQVDEVMAAAGVSPEAFVARVTVGGTTFDDLVERLTVGETYFFREPAQFDLLRDRILPDLRRRRGPAPPLRAWVAACASGEEAWSLAMLARESGEHVRVLATDVSRVALARAREGLYGEWSLRHEGRARAGRWLRREGAAWRVDPTLARSVVFGRLNLASGTWPSEETGTAGLDLVLCRNVLLYFDAETVAAVARRLFAALEPGGWLLTASSDPRLEAHAPLTVLQTPAGLVYRRELAAPAVEGPTAAWTSASVPRAGRSSAGASSPPFAAGGPAAIASAEPVAVGVPGPGASPASAASPTGAASPAGAAPPPEAQEVLVERVHSRAHRDGSAAALAYVDELVRTAPLVPAHHFLAGVLLLDLGRASEAAAAFRRALFLDGTSIIARFMLGNALLQVDDAAGARAAWHDVRVHCARLPRDAVLPLADGATVAQLAEAAAALLARAEGTR